MTDGIAVREDGVVLDVELRRPPSNLFTMQMCDTLLSLLQAPPAGVRILRLRGGPGVFCLGRERAGQTLEQLRHESQTLGEVNRCLRETPLLTIAEVSGDAAGFGVGLFALCDIAVAAQEAKFWFPEVTIGLAPALVLTWLPGIVGTRQAMWLTTSGETLSGEEALRLNLVTKLVRSPTDLANVVDGVIAALLKHPPHVHSEIRSILRTMEGLDFAATTKFAVDRLALASLAMVED
jgi:methylglutaconyl-CoA hydratase